MSRRYQISIGAEEAQRRTTPPPFPPASTRMRHKWSFDEADFGRIPMLREWLAAEGVRDVEERGFAGERGKLSATDSLVSFSTPATVRQLLKRADLVRADECPTCGRPQPRVVDDPAVELDAEPRAGALLTYVAELRAFAMPVEVVESLRAAGLAGGLGVVPIAAPGEPHVVVYSDVGVGEPVAPLGTTGERCATCRRAYRRTEEGDAYPALPRYCMYPIFEHATGDSQWVWNTTDGQLWPIVTPDVARWLRDRDPEVTFVKRGWSPDELEQAFLPEQYR